MGEFEKDIRDMFEDLELQIDTDKLWSGIEKKLDKKDRKYPLWWLFSSVILFMSIIIYISINIKTGDKTTDNNNNIQQSTNKVNTIENHNNNNNNELKQINKINTGQETKTNKKQIKENEKKKKASKRISFLIAANQESKKNKILTHKDFDKNPEKQNIPVNIANSSFNEKQQSKHLILNSISGKFNLSYTPIEILYKRELITYFDKKQIKKINSWSKSMDFSLGFALVNKSLKTKSAGFNSYLNKRLSTENYLEAFNSSLDLNINHKSGFFISTGIHLTQIDERFMDVDSLDLHKTNNGITKEIQNGDGTISYLKGEKEVIEHVTWDKIIYNYYTFIEIPVIVGYRYDLKNISLEFNSGLSYNVFLLKRGQIIGIKGLPIDLATEKNIFKKQSGLSLIAGMKLIFPVKKKVFFIEPNIKYNLQDITSGNYPLHQRYFNYGIKLGYRYNFRTTDSYQQ